MEQRRERARRIREEREAEEAEEAMPKGELPSIPAEMEVSDRRLNRLRKVQAEDRGEEDRRKSAVPQIISIGEDRSARRPRRHAEGDESESSEEEENVERRHAALKERLIKEEEELLADAEEDEEEDDKEDSEYEEYTDSEEDVGPRLKPVFVRKKDRMTLKEQEEEEKKRKEEEAAKKAAEERRQEALRIVKEQIKEEEEKKREDEEEEQLRISMAAVKTDDEDEEAAYESWKVRELKRIKRDREEREAIKREAEEAEKLRNMTEEERQAYLKAHPKVITNKADKGKYRFLQKYYHRGVFFLDQDQEVFKRDFAQPTLEDHFDKTTLPKVMQVKNFGRSGRTKYTHLVDQDTTAFDSPWADGQSATTSKFYTTKAGGMKQVFERPSGKRNK